MSQNTCIAMQILLPNNMFLFFFLFISVRRVSLNLHLFIAFSRHNHQFCRLRGKQIFACEDPKIATSLG